jgi:hypothetical protein
LLTLAQRYEKSSKAEDREKALVLRQAIDLATREGIDNQFNKLADALQVEPDILPKIEKALGGNGVTSTEAMMQSWRSTGLGFAANHIEAHIYAARLAAERRGRP